MARTAPGMDGTLKLIFAISETIKGITTALKVMKNSKGSLAQAPNFALLFKYF